MLGYDALGTFPLATLDDGVIVIVINRVAYVAAELPARRGRPFDPALFAAPAAADAPPFLALRRSLIVVEEPRRRLIVPVAVLFPDVQAPAFPVELLVRRVPGWMRDPARPLVVGWQTVIVAEGAAAADPFPVELLRAPRPVGARVEPTPPIRVLILPIEGAPDAPLPSLVLRRRAEFIPEGLIRLVPWVAAQLAPPPVADDPPLSPIARRRAEPIPERVLRITPWVAAQQAPPVVDDPPLAPPRPRRVERAPERLRITSPWAAVQAATPSFDLPVELLRPAWRRAPVPAFRWMFRGRFDPAVYGGQPAGPVALPLQLEDRSGSRYGVLDQSSKRYLVVDQSGVRYAAQEQSKVSKQVEDQSGPKLNAEDTE
jgi:hypothetical protein